MGLPTENDPGAVGAVATEMLVVAVLVPFALTAERVYMVEVEREGVVVDPMRVLVEYPPGVITTDDALLTFQERLEIPLRATTVGEAEKEEIVGEDPPGQLWKENPLLLPELRDA